VVAVVVAVGFFPVPARAGRGVEDGAYHIVSEQGGCLRGEGSPSALVTVGTCDTIWTISRREGEGVTVAHAVRRTCLDQALLAILPPRVATMPCDTRPVRPWGVQEVEPGRVRFLHGGLAMSGFDAHVVLSPPGTRGQVWSLRRLGS